MLNNSNLRGRNMAKVTAIMLAMAILTISPLAIAASKTCEVVSITDKEVVLKCEDVKELIVGDQVKIKTKKNSKAIEGC